MGTEPASPVETLLHLATVMTSRIIRLGLLGTTEIGLGGSVDQLHVDVKICQPRGGNTRKKPTIRRL